MEKFNRALRPTSSAMLICLLNQKFRKFKIILFGISFLNEAGGTCICGGVARNDRWPTWNETSRELHSVLDSYLTLLQDQSTDTSAGSAMSGDPGLSRFVQVKSRWNLTDRNFFFFWIAQFLLLFWSPRILSNICTMHTELNLRSVWSNAKKKLSKNVQIKQAD